MDIGDVGIDNSDDEVNRKEAESLDSQTDVNTNNLSSLYADQSLACTDNQIRRAIANSSAPVNSSSVKDLSHLSHLSHTSHHSKAYLTNAMIAEFFHDDGRPYHPLLPHMLDESPCKLLIRIDNDGFYYCIMHPNVQNIHLETIEHHIKYKDAELHKLEIVKLLDIYQSVK